MCPKTQTPVFSHVLFLFIWAEISFFHISFCFFVFARDFTITDAWHHILIVVHAVDVIELQHYKQGSFHLSSLFFLLFMLSLVTCFLFYFWLLCETLILSSAFKNFWHNILCAKKKRTETFFFTSNNLSKCVSLLQWY